MFHIAFTALYEYIFKSEVSIYIYYYIYKNLKIRKIQKHLKNWRLALARLQTSTINYIFQPTTHNIREWYVKKPDNRTEITYRPYGYHKWERATLARRTLLLRQRHAIAFPANNKDAIKSNLTFDSDSYPILVDSGASYTISNDINDFIKPPKESNIRIKGYNGSYSKTKVGTVKWNIQDDNGKVHSITLPGTYYVPDAEIRMLSPQHWAQVTNDIRGTSSTTFGDIMVLRWNKLKYQKIIPICPKGTNNVGIMSSPAGIKKYLHLCDTHDTVTAPLAFSSTIDFDDTQAAIVSESEDEGDHPNDLTITSDPDQTQQKSHHTNQTKPDSTQTNNMPQHPLLVEFDDQLDATDSHPTFDDNIQEYMHWHYRLNHASFNTMLNMAKLKQLPKEISSIIKKMDKHHQKPPLCSDCTCATACRKQWRAKPKKDHIKPNKRLVPGDVVSMDQLVSSTPGLIACLHGGRPTTERYVGSTVFVDQASDFCYIYHHTSLNSEETVKAKLAFEAEAKRHGVTIKHYHADNGLFRSKNFKAALEKAGQTISYAGVGAHHQNGIAEKRIGDLQRRATTLLLHAQRRWPDAINVHLWPYALRCANETRNTTPTKGHDQCPLSRFNGSDFTPSYRHQHHFGCPVYVLDKNIQDGKKARKWIDRTRIGINLGPSPKHASSVALILSLQTGLVSPQFHCSYDDLFESTTGTQARAMPKSHWQYKCGFTSSPPEGDNQHEGVINQSEPTEVTNIINDDQTEATPLSETIPTQPYVTRSGRTSKPPERLAFKALLEPFDYLEPDLWHDQHPLAFKASTDPDSMYYHQAMKEPDRKKFEEAMDKELEDHLKKGNYKLFLRSKLPRGATVLPAVWQLRRKRVTKTGKILKWKARICIDGSKMKHGIHYEETYAPVVSWGATRFFLTLATINNWHTRQLDFVMAFTQADVERELYMELPKRFTMPGTNITYEDRDKYVLKVVKNLYGQKQAGKVWYDHLRERLTTLGFKQSKHDECVFYYGSTIFVVYTDDTILIGPDQKEIDKIFNILDKNFKIEDQGTLNDYLGVNIEKRKDGKLEMTQPTLILSILKDLGLWETNHKNKPTVRTTPALSTVILTSHEEDEDFDNKAFDYRQVVGKLLYLEKSTRPDIACAVHQCARFCTAPKAKHAEAVKRIGRYLLGTKDKGLIINPKEDSFDCWVDASHASEWSSKTAIDDPNTARSRMGYVICYAGCPMFWASKMQTEIALSSTEAEYIALSQSMREVLPLMWLLEEAQQRGMKINAKPCKVHCKVFEDNEGAIEIAKVPKMRPRTKHLNIKYHHFREEVSKGTVSIYHVKTEDQMADMLTKPLDQKLFEAHREKMMGW